MRLASAPHGFWFFYFSNIFKKGDAVTQRNRTKWMSLLRIAMVGVLTLFTPLVASAEEGAVPGSYIEEEVYITAPLHRPESSDMDVDIKRQQPIFVPNEIGEPSNKELVPKSTTVILNEGFEGAFPGSWGVSGAGGVYWDDTSYRSHLGSWSVWCADGGVNGQPAGGNYLNDMYTWMAYGPFNLSDAVAGSMSFWLWNDSELNTDWITWAVSIDGANYMGTRFSGTTSGWQQKSIDFTNVPGLGDVTGNSSVSIAFFFESDGSITGPGAYVDDVHISKTVNDGSPDLVVLSPSVSNPTPAVGEIFTTNATVRNQGGSPSSSTTLRWYTSADNTISTSDTEIATDSVPALATGQSLSESTSGSFSSSGTLWLGACVDSVSGEGNVGNNCSNGVLVTVGGGGGGSCNQDLNGGVVCLRNGRFEFTATWTDFATTPVTRPLIWTPVEDINATGGFQNNPSGIQIVMRVADGCSITGTWWVWLGGFTDAGWDITVRDTMTRKQRTFSKPRQGGVFPITARDTTTFTCN
jgi:hypothetical protein